MESNSTLMELNKLSTVELSTALAEEDESQSRIKDILSYRALQCHMLLANYPENGIQNKRTIRYFPILSQYHIKSDTEGAIVRQFSTVGHAGMPHLLVASHIRRVLISSLASTHEVRRFYMIIT